MALRPLRTQTFTEHLKQALEWCDSPETLGSQSPLAAPYFLGAAMRGADPSALGRGQALCDEIQRSVESLWRGPLPDDGAAMLDAALADQEGAGRYDCLILELNYFRQRVRPAPRNQAEIYHDILHISRPTHDRHLRAAVDRLGGVLLQRLRPAVRAEQPITPPALIGRDELLSQLVADLEAGKAVALTGPGGIGKTSLAATVADRWQSPAVFWCTIRPTLNDQVESLLFALGHFLHTQGASTLWHQLIADGGRIKDVHLGLGLAVADLASLPRSPLLCCDEMDFLRPLTQDQPNPQHTQLLELLDSLRGHTALLLIGQQVYWPSDAIYALDAWTPEQLAAWLTGLGVAHDRSDVTRLHAYTAGNPRLAELCVAFYQTGAGDSLAAALDQLPQFQALLPLWVRLERRLPLAERRVLQALSVFRSAAPADVWLSSDAEPADALAHLIARRLVQEDGLGGVALLPALRDVIYGELPAETAEELHSQAAQIRAERGEFTAAAYHLVRAGQPDAAVELWFPQRSGEVQRGQAAAALAVFGPVAARRLAARRRKELLLLRSELYALLGEPARVIDELAQDDWPADDPATPEAKLRLGQAHEAQGQSAAALDLYQAGLDAVNRVLGQGAQLHVQRSFTHLRQREMHPAWREANLARFHAEIMLGVVQDQQGDYLTARQHYLTALDIAQETEFPAGIAQANHYLAMLIGRRLQMDEALPYFEQAMRYYEQIGDRVQREYVRGNLASAYIQSRRFAEALVPAELALRFFQAMGNPFRVAQNASNLAEAHAELGNLDPAQHFAEVVLQQEEPHSHPYALYTLGTVYKQRGDATQAAQYYDHSRQMAEANDDTYLLAFAWRALAEIHVETGALPRADAAFDQAVELFRRLGIEEEVQMTETMRARGDAKVAQVDA